MQNILSKYSILYLTNQTNRSAHKDYFSNPKGVTWEAVLNVQDWFTVRGGVTPRECLRISELKKREVISCSNLKQNYSIRQSMIKGTITQKRHHRESKSFFK